MNELLPAPVVLFSDLHLCSKSHHHWQGELERLRGLWADAKTVIFNGDSISWKIARHHDQCEKIRDEITDYFRSHGLETVFIAGNSDQEVCSRDYQFIRDEKILVLHGHAIFKSVSPWNYHAAKIKQLRHEFLESIPQTSRNTLDVATQSARTATVEIQRQCMNNRCKTGLSSYIFLKRHNFRTLMRISKILKSWKTAPKLGADFMERYAPQAKFLIMGHTHRSGVWKIGERIIINTGSIKKPRTALYIRIENDVLKVFRIRRDKKQLICGQLVEEFEV
ncbi:MAG: metallophosphoesterase family protein [Phycisphaerae bacterium]|nr:metallophosphoesterase family protein [Phycisphaerae bacterium]